MKILIIILLLGYSPNSEIQKDTLGSPKENANVVDQEQEDTSATPSESEFEELIRSYQLTNDRINNQLTFIGVIATVFGVILALGSIFIGFESIKTSKDKKDALATLDEAKKYVNQKKEEFDALIKEKIENIDQEYKKVLALVKEQLIENLDSETTRVRQLAKAKFKEIEAINVESSSDELKQEFDKKFEFLESVGIPDDPEVLKSKIEFLRNKYMFEETIKLATRLVEIKPEDQKGYWELAYAHSKLGDNEKSIKNYLEVLKISPESSSANNNLGIQYELTDRLYDALQKIDRAIELDNKESLYQRNRGRILFKLNSPEEAIASYKKAIELSPDKYFIYQYLINHLKELERYDEAIDTFELAITNIESQNLEINFEKAQFLIGIERFEDARKIFQILIQSNYRTEHCHVNIYQTYLKQNKLDDAISSIESAISLNPKAQYLHILKMIALFKKNKKAAWEYIYKTGEEFESSVYFQTIGRELFKEGFIEDAKKAYTKANEIIAKNLEQNEDPDITNYFEGLIITSDLETSQEFYESYFEKVKDMKYRLLMQFLHDLNLLSHSKIEFKDIKINAIKEYFKSAKANWTFTDIFEHLKSIQTDENLLEKIELLTKFMSHEIGLDELNKQLDETDS